MSANTLHPSELVEQGEIPADDRYADEASGGQITTLRINRDDATPFPEKRTDGSGTEYPWTLDGYDKVTGTYTEAVEYFGSFDEAVAGMHEFCERNGYTWREPQ